MSYDFSNLKVAVIGDLMLDNYIIGKSLRQSPEANVPVVLPLNNYSKPGGAANVCMNIKNLGANVDCYGIIGDDKWGKILKEILNSSGINFFNLSNNKDLKTTLKQRVYSNGNQVLRIDDEEISKNIKLDNIKFDNYDFCIFSDYNKGVINNIPNINRISFVDPKKDKFSYYKNTDVITPNIIELEKVTKKKLNDIKSIVDECRQLIQENNFKYIVTKRGSKGMVVVGENFYENITVDIVKNPDVTGAGDTVISVLSLVYFQTKDIIHSAKIANRCASEIVKKEGTNSISLKELNLIR